MKKQLYQDGPRIWELVLNTGLFTSSYGQEGEAGAYDPTKDIEYDFEF